MDDRSSGGELGAEAILKKVVMDFNRLENTIASAIEHLRANGGLPDDLAALQRALAAARNGAALAQNKIAPD